MHLERAVNSFDHVSDANLVSDRGSIIINADPETEVSANMALNNTPPDSVLWPWLHEDLFLQNDVNIDWFDISTSAGPIDMDDSSIALPYDQAQSSHDVGLLNEHQRHQSAQAPDERGFDDPFRLNAVEALVSAASLSTKGKSADTRLNAHGSSFLSGISSICKQIETAFEFTSLDKYGSYHQTTCHSLRMFLQLFEKHFWPLWPFTPHFMFQSCDFDPLLCLAMISIGAMYGTRQASVFGSMLHVRLRDELVNPLLDIDVTRKCMLSLGQARSLTQAAALYFGQKRAFSYAQHLGGTLIAQARKMSLFSASESEAIPQSQDVTAFVDDWVNKESRKRLAFAILRLEMYTSLLHSTRPLVSGEEIDLGLPCSHELWSTSFVSREAFAAAIRQEAFSDSPKVPYSDLVRITSDPSERLPHLKMLHLELLMNAMQEQVWASWSAKSSLAKLTSSNGAEIVIDTEFEDRAEAPLLATAIDQGQRQGLGCGIHVHSLDSHLASGSRKMVALRTRLRDTVSALAKVRDEVLDVTRIRSPTQGMSQADRSSLLSCLLIYHLAFIQLSAPLRSIHQVCHSQCVHGARASTSIDSTAAQSWTSSDVAPVAVRHAMSIYNLLKAETGKPRDVRASVNFLTMIGLYNSAAVVWVYVNLCEDDDLQRRLQRQSAADTPSMAEFEKVLQDINPAWAGRSSFLTVIQKLRQSSPPFNP